MTISANFRAIAVSCALAIGATLPTVASAESTAPVMSETKKFEALGALYTKRFMSDTIFRAATEQNKILSSKSITSQLLKEGIISNCGRESSVTTSFDQTTNAADLNVRFSPYTCDIQDLESFYFSVVRDKYLSYFPLKTKIGTWWAYVDTSSMDTWEIYFWLAFFTDQGSSPEYSPETGMLVVNNFIASDGAIAFRDSHPETPVQLAYVGYRETPSSLDAEPATITEIIPSHDDTSTVNEESNDLLFIPIN